MPYTWVPVNNKWQLISKKNNKTISKFYLPSILDSSFKKAVIDKRGKMIKVDNDVFKIFFDKEIDVKSLVEDFIEPRFLIAKMNSNTL